MATSKSMALVTVFELARKTVRQYEFKHMRIANE